MDSLDPILQDLGSRLARTRLRADLTQEQLAERAGVSVSTVRRLEAGEGSQLTAFLAVLRALGLEQALDAALPQATPGPVEVLDHRGSARQRASGRGVDTPDAAEDFRWGDES